METFWFFRLRLYRVYDFAYESDFWFPKGHKRSYDELNSTKGGNRKRTKSAAYTQKLKGTQHSWRLQADWTEQSHGNSDPRDEQGET